ncbi:hypothetical protein TCAL_17339 [Tigriopus californicus]|uniref:Uncharacterized protein n=1 Tax=Tigriopus californicus TaxID=6832 RepID=A0A553NYF6_TIGCA|nr:hypothetical protein TCAL_17339 [Tigriopus californicus]
MAETFINTPIQGKPVTDIPGIGPYNGKILEKNKFSSVQEVLTQCTSLGMDKETCKRWFMQMGINEFNASMAFNALEAYSRDVNNKLTVVDKHVPVLDPIVGLLFVVVHILISLNTFNQFDLGKDVLLNIIG